jgi:uncharacterized linocin/CFP29 family protein
MKPLTKVGLETGSLTDEELRYLDSRVVETVRPLLVGRKLYPVFRLPNAGIKTVRGWKETDMSQATIDMNGQVDAFDRIELDDFDIKVPVISKGFRLNWRDILASRNGGIPLDARSVENATRQVAEEEDKLLLTGEYTGWNALGIEGLNTATGRNTQGSAGAWGANSIVDVSACISKLEEDGHYGPYALVVRSAWYAKLRALIANTGIFYLEKVAELVKAGIFVSDNLFSSAGATTIALVCEPSQENFELVIGQDMSTWTVQDENMNTKGKVYEVVAPRIKRPASICELTGLS